MDRVKSGIFGQTAIFGQRPCLFHISNDGIKNKLTKRTVKILMRRLIRSRLMTSEFTLLANVCPNLPDVRIYPTLPYILTLSFNSFPIYKCWLMPQDGSLHFWKRCFLKTSVSNGIIYTKYTQNPHTIEPPFNIATQSATYTVTGCVSRWEPNGLNANNPCPAARQKQYWYFISLLRFSALKCKPNGQKNVVVLENLIIESLHMIETEL